MATLAAQLAEAEADRLEIRAAISKIRTQSQSSAAGDMSMSRANLRDLNDQLIACEKRIQRLLNGGRGILVDLSASAAPTSTETTEV